MVNTCLETSPNPGIEEFLAFPEPVFKNKTKNAWISAETVFKGILSTPTNFLSHDKAESFLLVLTSRLLSKLCRRVTI
jgi:hypothetical protein